jgi:hypothetical protein
VLRYLNKTYGDSQYTLSVLHAYQQKTSSSAHLVNQLKYKESTISSKRINAQYSLPACDEGFKTFSKKFDDVTKAAVLDIYGKFSEFTTPILSLDQITELANVFHKEIPHYYEMISTLLNREQYAQHKRTYNSKLLWHHFILYTFCMLMRIRNDQNFSWWALINSASMYGNGANHLAVYFGFRYVNYCFLILNSITCPSCSEN